MRVLLVLLGLLCLASAQTDRNEAAAKLAEKLGATNLKGDRREKLNEEWKAAENKLVSAQKKLTGDTNNLLQKDMEAVTEAQKLVSSARSKKNQEDNVLDQNAVNYLANEIVLARGQMKRAEKRAEEAKAELKKVEALMKKKLAEKDAERKTLIQEQEKKISNMMADAKSADDTCRANAKQAQSLFEGRLNKCNADIESAKQECLTNIEKEKADKRRIMGEWQKKVKDEQASCNEMKGRKDADIARLEGQKETEKKRYAALEKKAAEDLKKKDAIRREEVAGMAKKNQANMDGARKKLNDEMKACAARATKNAAECDALVGQADKNLQKTRADHAAEIAKLHEDCQNDIKVKLEKQAKIKDAELKTAKDGAAKTLDRVRKSDNAKIKTLEDDKASILTDSRKRVGEQRNEKRAAQRKADDATNELKDQKKLNGELAKKVEAIKKTNQQLVNSISNQTPASSNENAVASSIGSLASSTPLLLAGNVFFAGVAFYFYRQNKVSQSFRSTLLEEF